MSSSIRPVKGQVAVVTGGSSGLGRGVVQQFLGHGAKVINFDLRPGDSEVTGSDLNYSFVRGSVTSEEDVARLCEYVAATSGRLDVLANNAGVITGFQALVDPDTGDTFSLEKLRNTLEVNVVGAVNVISKCAKLMLRNTPDAPDGLRGVVVMTGSISGREGNCQTGMIDYVASKAAINGMTSNLAAELVPHGIRVVTICPASFATSILDGVDAGSVSTDVARWRTNIMPRRLGTPEEFGHSVRAVVENPYLNGAQLRLDGMSRHGVDHRLLGH